MKNFFVHIFFIDKKRNIEAGCRKSPNFPFIKWNLRCKCALISKGFTLLEVLVSLAIVSIIITVLYSSFFLSHKAVEAVDDSLIKIQEARAVLDVIKREIESAFYSADKSYSIFKIDDMEILSRQASRISFTSFSNLMPGVSKISYAIDEDAKKFSLIKKISSAYSLSAEPSGVEMIEDIESFAIEARYMDKWVKTWDSALITKIPDEIKINIVILINGGKDKVSIYDIAKPRLTGQYEY